MKKRPPAKNGRPIAIKILFTKIDFFIFADLDETFRRFVTLAWFHDLTIAGFDEFAADLFECIF
jgi:hypothetical protein